MTKSQPNHCSREMISKEKISVKKMISKEKISVKKIKITFADR